MKLGFVVLAQLWLSSAVTSVAGPTNDLAAFYPLATNGDDALGKNPPFVLTNTPFIQGAVYINGVYQPNGHFVHDLSTEELPFLKYDSFTISLDFCPYPLPWRRTRLSRPESFINLLTSGRYGRWVGFYGKDQLNILTGGQIYRWIGLNREDNRLNLTLNNQRFAYRYNVKVRPNRWHRLICSVDFSRKEIRTFFDGRELKLIKLPPEFKLEVLDSHYRDHDREFTFANYSQGSVYRGYAANLRIYSRALAPEEMALLSAGSFDGLPRFASRNPSSLYILVLLVSVPAILVVLVIRRLLVGRTRQRAGTSGCTQLKD